MELLRRVTARMSSIMGRVGYVAAIRYALRLAAAHLGAAADFPIDVTVPVPGAPAGQREG